MEFIKLALIVLITVILTACLPIYDKPVSNLITISASVVIIFYILNTVSPVIAYIKTFFGNNLSFDLSIVYKSMGISIITQFIADIAADSGNKALANQIILTGKVAITALALPLLARVLEIIGQLTL